MDAEQNFLKALKSCNSLVNVKGEPSSIPCQTIELLCSVAKEEYLAFRWSQLQYSVKVEEALVAIDEYARSCDNWRIYNQDCSLGFGVKDHCTILSFLLNLPSSNYTNYTGNFNSAEIICDLLQEWRGFDFRLLSTSSPELIPH
jgi:hypothetical protein